VEIGQFRGVNLSTPQGQTFAHALTLFCGEADLHIFLILL